MAKIKKTKQVSESFCFKCYADTFIYKLAQLSQTKQLSTQTAVFQPLIYAKSGKKLKTKKVSKIPKKGNFCFNSRHDGFFYMDKLVFNEKTKELYKKFIPIYHAICPKKSFNDILANESINLKNTHERFAKIIQVSNEKKLKQSALDAERKETITSQILLETKTLKNKAASKFYSLSYIEKLAEIDSPLQQSYKNSLECANDITQNGNKLTSRYCKQRWCTVCNRIRTAKLINGYMPQIDKFEKPFFLTLTTTNCNAKELPNTIDALNNKFRFIYKKLHKKYEVGSCTKSGVEHDLKGIKKIECTYNFLENTYHPHLHFILKSEDMAREILDLWLKKKQPKFVTDSYIDKLEQIIYNSQFKKLSKGLQAIEKRKQMKLDKFNEYKNLVIDEKGQNLKAVYKNENLNGAKELFKYFTKIVSKTSEFEFVNVPQKNSIYIERVKKEKQAIVIPAMNEIFCSMYRRRVYEPFGIKAVNEKIEDLTAETFEHLTYDTLTYKWNGIDWQHENNLLSNYHPDNNLLSLIDNIIY